MELRGYEKVWFIGDEFCYRTYQSYFKKNMDKEGKPITFTFKQFEVRSFFNSKYVSHDPSVLSRIHNCLVKALNENATLPKVIIFVLDNGILKEMAHNGSGISIKIETQLNWLLKECEKVVTMYKAFLPSKSVREYVPNSYGLHPCNINFLAKAAMSKGQE